MDEQKKMESLWQDHLLRPVSTCLHDTDITFQGRPWYPTLTASLYSEGSADLRGMIEFFTLLDTSQFTRHIAWCVKFRIKRDRPWMIEETCSGIETSQVGHDLQYRTF